MTPNCKFRFFIMELVIGDSFCAKSIGLENPVMVRDTLDLDQLYKQKILFLTLPLMTNSIGTYTIVFANLFLGFY